MGRKILTKAVLATIPQMIAQDGLSAREIAQKLGCQMATLRVRCSQQKISLSRRRRPNEVVRISRTALALLRNRAVSYGKTEAVLAAELLEAIARDNLYEAVLDGGLDSAPNRQPVEA